jgi:hypothetical protein
LDETINLTKKITNFDAPLGIFCWFSEAFIGICEAFIGIFREKVFFTAEKSAKQVQRE